MSTQTRQLPQWIWHQDRDNKLQTVITHHFKSETDITNARLSVAFTGAATISLNGTELQSIAESANNITGFHVVQGFPDHLPAGEYEVKIAVSCTKIVPIADVNHYLWQRRVGLIGILSADQAWIVTDSSWLADGQPAAEICLLGEEPFGDLDNSPDWFVEGGFGDIAAYNIEHVVTLGQQAVSYGNQQGLLNVQGSLTGSKELSEPQRPNLELFYHLRKQSDWHQMRAIQQAMDWSGVPSITVDLGKEYNARFYVENLEKSSLTILWNGAESLHELEHYQDCITEWFEVPANGSFCTLPQGMRYVTLYFIGTAGEPFHVSLRFQSAHVALNQVGQLQSGDQMLDQVYEVAAHTSRICHQIGLWDGIKRDRLNWTFDFYLAAKSCYFLWDDYSVLQRAVRELGNGTPYGKWMNGICEYTLWWVKTLCEYYAHTGDKSFVLEMEDALQRHVSWVGENVNSETGRLMIHDSILIEWAPLTAEEKNVSLQAIYRMTQQDLVQLVAAVPELRLEFTWPLPELPEAAFTAPGNQLATKVLGISSGYVSKEGARQLLETLVLGDPLTPLSAYTLAECYSQFGMHDKAYQVISFVWGQMVERGATTFWESFTDQVNTNFHDALTTYTAYNSYRMSLCHAWSSTPVKWISEHVLGVQALEPGFKTIRFSPIAVGGIRQCSGTVNTPYGIIRVAWELDDKGELQGSIDLPKGIEIKDAQVPVHQL